MGLRNRHTQPVYYNELYDIEDFIGTSCLNNDDLHAPTFLWDSQSARSRVTTTPSVWARRWRPRTKRRR